MDEQNSPIFTQAKLEYTKQLIDILSPQLFDGIKSIYDEAKTVNSVNRRQTITLLYREFLEKVPSWSNVLVESETERIVKMSICDWMDDLITAVFISHTKILTSIGMNTTNNTIDLVIPKITTFVHKCYINIAREMWKNPYFFTENVVASEYQKNMRTVELIIKECIENTIRQLLPIKEILKQNLEKSNLKKSNDENINSNDIKELLLKEIQNLNLLNLIKPIDNDDEVDIEDEEVELKENTDDLINENIINENIINENITNLLGKENEEEDDYVSVDEETIQNNCENLEINTLENDLNDEPPTNKVEEEKYDNIDIVNNDDETSGNKSILEKFMENLTMTNEVNNTEDVIDDDNDKEISTNVIENIEDILENKEIKSIITKTQPEPEQDHVKEEDMFDINAVSKKSDKELISVEKISDTETVDEFFNDVSKIIESKTDISVNKDPEKYTLFDDADNNE